MVQTLGMSDKLGYISFESGDLVKSYRYVVYLVTMYRKSLMTRSSLSYDKPPNKWMKCWKKEKTWLKSFVLNRMAKALIQHESLDLQQIVEILGERPFSANETFLSYLQTKKDIE